MKAPLLHALSLALALSGPPALAADFKLCSQISAASTSDAGSALSIGGEGDNARPFLTGERVHDGEPAKTIEGAVSIRIVKPGGTVRCTGSLIADRWVLTAAHCMFGTKNAPATGMTVHYDSLKALSGSGIGGKAYCHPDYGFATRSYVNDLALIRLDSPVKGVDLVTLVRHADGPMRNRPAGTRFRIRGFGEKAPKDLTRVLLESYVRTADKDLPCRSAHHTPEMLFCSRTNGDRNAPASLCHGDSGGPAMYETPDGRHVQVGVNSFIYNSETGPDTYCGGPGNYAGFVELHSYLPWIDAVMKAIP